MSFNLKKYTSTLGGLLISILITSGTVFLLMVMYFYVYLPAITNHGETITVPNIEGMQVEQLEEFLLTRNLRYEVNDSSYTEKYPPLTVLKQYPVAGSQVKENRVIYISINRITPPTVPMPNLVDGSLVNAEVQLKSNELKRGRIQLVRGPFMHVVKEMKFNGEKIEPGTRITKGSVIDLIVYDGGSDSLPCPYVVDQALEDAKVAIFGSNLNLDVEVVGDTLGAEEVVILKQKPEANENIRVGDIVKVWVGKKGTTLPEDLEIEEQN
ncbi:MAG TPA: PASTA domain-containing protein [Cyclobacteriaceae bacterium]|nr:PASTA domain-containing protein [Cyclobacteriaceae bacterium]